MISPNLAGSPRGLISILVTDDNARATLTPSTTIVRHGAPDLASASARTSAASRSHPPTHRLVLHIGRYVLLGDTPRIFDCRR